MLLPSLTTEGHSSWAAFPQVRISLRRAAILAGAGAADDVAGDWEDSKPDQAGGDDPEGAA